MISLSVGPRLTCGVCGRFRNEEQALDDTVDAALFGLKDRYAQCPCCLQTAPPGLRRDAEYRRQVRIWLSETHEEED